MMNRCIYLFCWLCLACWSKPVSAEGQALLVIPEPGEKTLIHSDWYARKANEVKMDGNRLSAVPLDKTGWLPARVPGTVLTTLLENGLYPAPEFGLNNNLIPDIHEVGNDFFQFIGTAVQHIKRKYIRILGKYTHPSLLEIIPDTVLLRIKESALSPRIQ